MSALTGFASAVSASLTLGASANVGDFVIYFIADTPAGAHQTATMTGASGTLVEKGFQANATVGITLLVASVTGAGTPTITSSGDLNSASIGWILSGGGSITPKSTWTDSNNSPLSGSTGAVGAGVYVETWWNDTADSITGWSDGATQDSHDTGYFFAAAHKTGIASGTYTPGCTISGGASVKDRLFGAYFEDVLLGPTINAQPVNATVFLGSTATFSTTATTSGGALTYQWKVSTGGAFSNVTTGSGGTTASFTTGATNNSEAQNLYTYKCAVTDSNGTVDTNTVMLFVINGTSIAWTKA